VTVTLGYADSAGNVLTPIYDSDSTTTSAVRVFDKHNGAALNDPTNWTVTIFGDQ
jgi:hypothetical protein